jgi:AcrR family transcriptional regulator
MPTQSIMKELKAPLNLDTRNKAKTKQKIIEAVGKVIAESGFQKVGVNAIAREAGVDKVLIYRYFNDLPTLLREFAFQSDYWPSLKDFIEQSPPKPNELPGTIISRALLNLLHELQKRPLTQEIIKWELLEKNELTEELNKARKEMALEGMKAMEKVAPKFLPTSNKNLLAIHAIVCAGLVHLLLLSKNKDEFIGLNIQTTEDWQLIEEAVQKIFNATFQENL